MPLIPWTPTVLTITSATQSGGNTIYAYSSYSGSAPVVGMNFVISGFSNPNNNIAPPLYISPYDVPAHNGVTAGILTAVDLVGKTVSIVNAGANEVHAATGTMQPFRSADYNFTGNGAPSIMPISPWVQAFPIDTVAGSILFAQVITEQSNSASASIVDTAGNNWILLQHHGLTLSFGSGYPQYPATVWLWYSVSKGGPSTVTVTSGSLTGVLLISEAQGPLVLDQTSWFTETHIFPDTSGNDPMISTPITTAFNDEIVIGFFFGDDGICAKGAAQNGFNPLLGGSIGPPYSANSGMTQQVWKYAPTAGGIYEPLCLVGASGGGADVASAVASFGLGTFVSAISGNAGVAGATITLSGDASASTTADGSGNYLFTGLANGNYVITPSLIFYTFSPSSRSETITGSDITGVNFTAIPATWAISGNAGIAGALVSWTGTSSGSTTADGSGNFTAIGLLNGSYTLTPSLSGYGFVPTSRGETISNANITGVNFILGTTATVTGAFHFANTARVANGSLTFTRRESHAPDSTILISASEPISTPLDSDGRFSVQIPTFDSLILQTPYFLQVFDSNGNFLMSRNVYFSGSGSVMLNDVPEQEDGTAFPPQYPGDRGFRLITGGFGSSAANGTCVFRIYQQCVTSEGVQIVPSDIVGQLDSGGNLPGGFYLYLQAELSPYTVYLAEVFNSESIRLSKTMYSLSETAPGLCNLNDLTTSIDTQGNLEYSNIPGSFWAAIPWLKS